MDATWHARPRGSATWTRASLRGKDVTWTHILFNIYMGLPCIRKQVINTHKIGYAIYASSYILFLRVGLKSLCFLYFQATWSNMDRQMKIAMIA